MQTTLRRLACSALLAALAAPAAHAQVSLLEVYELAIANDPAVREAEMRYLATAEQLPQARSSLLPQIDFSSTTSFNHSEDPNPPTDFITGQPSNIISSSESESDRDQLQVNLSQVIFDWSQYVSLAQADKTVTQAMTDYEFAKQDLMIRVAEAYFNVLASEDTLTAQEAAREAIGRQLEQAERRYEVGLIAVTEVQESQAGYDQVVADVIAAERVLATAREQLREIVGEYIGDLAAPGDDMPLERPQPENPEVWVETALEQNLQLMSARIGADIAEDGIRIQRASRFPTLNFQTGYSEGTTDQTRINNLFAGGDLRTSSFNEQEGFNWSINLRVPIFNGGLNGSRVQQAVYQHRASREALERVARQTELQTRDAYLGVISEISRVQALRQAVQSGRTALEATEAGFEVGTRTTVDVLTVQNNLRQTETTYARSRYDYILNVLRLEQASGGLSADDIGEVDGWLGNGGAGN